MKCPFCDTMDSKVIDSRLSKEGDITRRRRECERCTKRFTTYERVEETLPLVIKKDGRREPFDRHKVLVGIQKACEKRPVSMAMIESMVDDVLTWAQELGVPEMSGQQIGERVMEKLHELDEVAYVRFASVYRSFRDINEFMAELKDILNKSKA